MASTQSTQPFSDVSQPGADIEHLISSLQDKPALSEIDLELVRVFAKCYMLKHAVFVTTYPDGVQATRLDHDLLAVSQSMRSIGCDIRIPAFGETIMATSLRLYFDPCRDTIIGKNIAKDAVLLLEPTGPELPKVPSAPRCVFPNESIDLEPGAWTIFNSSPPAGQAPTPLLDLYLQPRRFCVTSDTTAAERTGSKRTGSERFEVQEQAGSPSSSKKQKASTGSRHIQRQTTSHPLLDLGDGETVHMTGQNLNDTYKLTRFKQLTSTMSASLYTAEYSLRPGQVIAVKAIKFGHSALSAIEQWHREITTHESIGHHPSIIRLYSSDARALTLHMEFVNSPALHQYIDASNMCERPRASFTILSDIASALQFIHASGFVHNDIKPSNILYRPNRDAILIDFGVGGKTAETHDGGTPWYLPPEYANKKSRGPQGDVFALGVTMLWVLQKCSLPEKNPGWKIRDIHEGASHAQKLANDRMREWLKKVEVMKSQLSQSEQSIESVVRSMLCEKRSTAEDVVKRLQSVKRE